jgi:hypothetical protein
MFAGLQFNKCRDPARKAKKFKSLVANRDPPFWSPPQRSGCERRPIKEIPLGRGYPGHQRAPRRLRIWLRDDLRPTRQAARPVSQTRSVRSRNSPQRGLQQVACHVPQSWEREPGRGWSPHRELCFHAWAVVHRGQMSGNWTRKNSGLTSSPGKPVKSLCCLAVPAPQKSFLLSVRKYGGQSVPNAA